MGGALLRRFGPAALTRLTRSWKVERLGEEHLRAAFDAPGRLLALWHGRMLLPLVEHERKGYSILVSPSDDGSLVEPVLRRFGHHVVRGSSNKEPARALRELLARLRGGTTIVLTPDGPRGPRHSVNPGPAWLARETGFPILPIGCAAAAAWTLRSWDAFTIPRPGSRVVIAYGELLRVPRGASDRDLGATCELLRTRLLAEEERAHRALGGVPQR